MRISLDRKVLLVVSAALIAMTLLFLSLLMSES